MNIEQAEKKFPIGTKVKYFPLLSDKTNFRVGTVRSIPWDLCGSTVVKITGEAGGLCVEHLEVMVE